MVNDNSNQENGSEQWHLEVNGKKFGPYSLAQIQGLIRHQEILGEDRITAPHLNGRWMTVQEFTSANAESSIPPRPVELTRSLIYDRSAAPLAVATRKEKNDPITGLFNVVQSARERQPRTQGSPAVVSKELDYGSGKHPSLPWTQLSGAALAGVLLVWGGTHFFSSAPPSTTPRSDEASTLVSTASVQTIKDAAPAPSTPALTVAPATSANPAPHITNANAHHSTQPPQAPLAPPATRVVAEAPRHPEPEREVEKESEGADLSRDTKIAEKVENEPAAANNLEGGPQGRVPAAATDSANTSAVPAPEAVDPNLQAPPAGT